MENASKALLIAAGMFFAILIVSLLVVFYNQISSYYAQQHEATIIEQTQKFNARFENYHRDNIRGSDLISLMNRVIDYNSTESYFDGTNYQRIRVKIVLGNDAITSQFKYETTDTTSINQYLQKNKIDGNWVITNTTGTGVSWKDDKNLTDITNTSSYLCEEAKNYGLYNLTDTKLQQLASKISNIIVNETSKNSTMDAYNRLKRADLIEDVLGLKVGDSADCDVRIDEQTGITKSDPNNIIEFLKETSSQYYQYMQFKRAYFDCTEVIYDEQTNRVVEMIFVLQTKNGTIVFD